MRETENYCKQTRETKSDIKKLYSVVVSSEFLVKGIAHESLRIPVSNLKTLSGKLLQIKGKNRLTSIILRIKPSQKQQDSRKAVSLCDFN